MKTFLKIAVLALVVIGAVVSIFVFRGTRIAKGVDVSHIKIPETVYMDDIQEQIDGIGTEWLNGFNKVDDLISVYYQNKLLSSDNEKKVKTSLVDKAALRLTSYALNEYFLRSSWRQVDINSIKSNSKKLLDYKAANGEKVAQGDTKAKLEKVNLTCQHYLEAREISLVYISNEDAKMKIDRADTLCEDSYLMHEDSIKSKLKNAERTIHDSHFNKIKNEINEFSDYTDRLDNTTDFSIVRDKVSVITDLIDNYNQADFYSSRDTDGVNRMKGSLNFIIKEWNKVIQSEREETYYESSYPDQQKTRRVRNFPSEQPIPELEVK